VKEARFTNIIPQDMKHLLKKTPAAQCFQQLAKAEHDYLNIKFQMMHAIAKHHKF
jgi:hypothetical protein